MWRYYELCTDLTAPEIAALRERAELGQRNPRDLKAELAKKIVADFYSSGEAERAEHVFDQNFKFKQPEFEPFPVQSGKYKVVDLLIATNLIASKKEARRLIEQGGVSVNKERCTRPDFEIDLTESDRKVLLQVGKRQFLEVFGANKPIQNSER